VVGSNEFVKVGNKNLRARQYPWGVVQVRLWEREREGAISLCKRDNYILSKEIRIRKWKAGSASKWKT
jgi:hypothetical protein